MDILRTKYESEPSEWTFCTQNISLNYQITGVVI